MKAKRKALVILFCAAAIATATAFSTLAYLTDTDSATNTFTVGKVDIELDEAKVDAAGVVETGADQQPLPRVTENEYHLIPGHTYVKDPQIRVDDNSEDCYVFVKVVNNLVAPVDTTVTWNGENVEVDCTGIELKTSNTDHKTIKDQMTANGWAELNGVENVYYYTYKKQTTDENTTAIVTKGMTLKVFEEFTIDGSVTNEQLAAYLQEYTKTIDGKKVTTAVTVTAYAVQADGFNIAGQSDAVNAKSAWTSAGFN